MPTSKYDGGESTSMSTNLRGEAPGKLRSYGDSLHLFNEAIDLLSKVKDDNWKEIMGEVLRKLLQALILLKGGGFRPPSDLTYLAAQALEVGAIDDKLFALIVEANLTLNNYLRAGRGFIMRVVSALLERAAQLDPYLNQQMLLFRY